MIAGRIDEMTSGGYNNELLDIELNSENDEAKTQVDEQESDIQTIERAAHKHKSDSSFRFLTAQTVVCIIALLIALGLKSIGGYYYEYSKSVFDKCFNTPINKTQVLGEDEARAIIAAQSTVYGMGGESADEGVKRLEDKSKLSKAQTNAMKSVNRMRLPVDSTTITCEYGYRIHPISGKRSFHTGIDIGEDSGKNIYSVLDGVVKKTVNDDPDYGNYVILTHTNGVETMYAHASRLCVIKGQKVKKGDIIAKVGTTGLSTGPHLHFEVRINDTRLNPRWFIDF